MSTPEDQSVPTSPDHHASDRVADVVEPAEAAPRTRGAATVKEREDFEGQDSPLLQPAAAATRKSRRLHATNDLNTKPGINTKKRARKNFIYGNYDTYYSYRPPSAPGDELTANESHIDPRLTALLPSWLDQKRIIDIGCNSGDITFALATEFGATSVLGVDIDNSLIQRANNRLASERQKLNPDECLANLDFRCENVVARKYRRDFASQKRRCGPMTKQPGSLVVAGPTLSERLPGANVKTLAQTSDGAVYDVVVCFSVTKWIHLNWGDGGLRTLFQRVYDMLPSAGLFILEPQPWKSYKKKYHLTETTKTHFKSIEMRPSEFVAYLTEVLGFHLLDTLRPAKAASPGFAARPIYVLQKLNKLKC
jgi:7SK snRNA methylphosphate capping enzyme